jgi:hypothetical protein
VRGAAFYPKVLKKESGGTPRLFFANPMISDNDVIRRHRPDVPSVAERHFHFARLSQGVFDVTITQDGAEVTRARLVRYQAVVFLAAINPPGVDGGGLIGRVGEGGASVGIHSIANTFQGRPAFGATLGARYDRRPGIRLCPRILLESAVCAARGVRAGGVRETCRWTENRDGSGWGTC